MAEAISSENEVPENVQPAADTGPARLPYPFARRFGVAIVPPLPGEGIPESCVVYRDGLSVTTIAEIRRNYPGLEHWERVDGERFDHLLGLTYQDDTDQAREMMEGLGDELDLASLANSVPETEDLLEQEDDAPIIRLINALLTQAVKENASDIHIETFERDLVVRMRVDGVLREVVKPKRALAAMLVSRIKVMAKLDIAEKRIPQDGRIPLRLAGREVDVRVSTMPSVNGERVVMRLLDKQAGRLDLNTLGMAENDLNTMRGLLSRPHGVVLVTGPTGSGKTTTLYAGLGQIDRDTLNVLTVEDPIEYNLPGVGQTQVNLKADMTFARGLRAILRQDPDVVMIGEIRDTETAEIAMRASLTGHLVLSTIHTNTAIGAITRLKDMGIEPFLLSSSLIGTLAQRLVRTLCLDCREPYTATDYEADLLHVDRDNPPTLYQARGCGACGMSGFRGRTGIYEVVPIDETLREMIHNNASEAEMLRQARHVSDSITADGRRKVLAGLTTLDEVMRVTEDF